MEDYKSKPESYWKEKLTSEQYYVTRQKGTERPFTGEYVNNKADGVYTCVACDLPLFASDTKFKSGTGWPSFWDVVEAGNVELKADHSHGMTRIEALCSRCGAHLGHLFDDGPAPTGQRYCINSLALNFEPGQSD